MTLLRPLSNRFRPFANNVCDTKYHKRHTCTRVVTRLIISGVCPAACSPTMALHHLGGCPIHILCIHYICLYIFIVLGKQNSIIGSKCTSSSKILQRFSRKEGLSACINSKGLVGWEPACLPAAAAASRPFPVNHLVAQTPPQFLFRNCQGCWPKPPPYLTLPHLINTAPL